MVHRTPMKLSGGVGVLLLSGIGVVLAPCVFGSCEDKATTGQPSMTHGGAHDRRSSVSQASLRLPSACQRNSRMRSSRPLDSMDPYGGLLSVDDGGGCGCPTGAQRSRPVQSGPCAAQTPSLP